MKRALAQLLVVGVLLSLSAGGCGWFESAATAMRKADEAMARQDWDVAIVKYSKVIHRKADYAKAWRRRGFCYVQKGEYQKGQEDMEEAMRLDPKFAGTDYVMGNSLMDQWKLDEAIAHFKRALEKEPKHPEAAAFHSGLALALCNRGRIDESMRESRQALEANPNLMEPHYVLACGLMLHKRPQEAIEEFKKALSTQPMESPMADNNRAYVMATCPIDSLRNGTEAVRLAEKANQQTGNKRLDVLDTLAAAYAEVGRFDDAVATAEKVVELARAQNAPDMANLMQQRASLYRAKKPLREPQAR